MSLSFSSRDCWRVWRSETWPFRGLGRVARGDFRVFGLYIAGVYGFIFQFFAIYIVIV